MANDAPDREEIRRQFEETISGMEVGDLDDLAIEFGDLAESALREDRPSLRKPPRDETAVYRVRIDLKRARPPIWRRLDLRSDITLDVVHRVIQAAFGWWDYHLHRFSLGGGPFDRHAEMFLCPFDVEEGDEGVPEAEVRLDETLAEPGDVLEYVYDYGDSWEMKIRLEEVLPADGNSPVAVCVGGRRAAPPEDCGGITDGRQLAEVVPDPAYFNVAEINAALRNPYFVMMRMGVPDPLIEVVYRLSADPSGPDVTERAMAAVQPGPELDPDQKAAALAPFRWYLDRAGEDGFELTAAGYLKPAVVKEAIEVVPAMSDWIGESNRESDLYPLLAFREALQKLGLLRKYKGRLVRTRAGRDVDGDAVALWGYLADRLLPEGIESFEDQATLLTCVYVATSDGPVPFDAVSEALTDMGWRYEDQAPIGRHFVHDLDSGLLSVFQNVGVVERSSLTEVTLSPEAANLARAVLSPRDR